MKSPTKKQKAWREWLRGCGSVISYRADCEIHHPAGRALDFSHWFMLALTAEEHRELLHTGGKDGLTELMERYEIWHPNNDVDIWDMSLHQFEIFLFSEQVEAKYHLPYGKDISEAISKWH